MINLRVKSLVFISLISISTLVLADADLIVDDKKHNDDSHEETIYPGQVEKNSEGTKIKRWSTKGPVAVSEAPQPFLDQNSTSLPNGTFINVLPNENDRAHPSRRKVQ